MPTTKNLNQGAAGSNKRKSWTAEENEKILRRGAEAEAAGITHPWRGQAKKLLNRRLACGARVDDDDLYRRAKKLRERERARPAHPERWTKKAKTSRYIGVHRTAAARGAAFLERASRQLWTVSA